MTLLILNKLLRVINSEVRSVDVPRISMISPPVTCSSFQLHFNIINHIEQLSTLNIDPDLLIKKYTNIFIQLKRFC